MPTRRVLGIDLCLSGHLQASDNLDYVYGLLAVTKAPIVPDYAKSISEVYSEFTEWLVKGSNRILGTIPRGTPKDASLWTEAILVQTIKTVCHKPVPRQVSQNRFSFVDIVLEEYGRTTYFNGKSVLEIVCCTCLLKPDDTYDTDDYFRLSGMIQCASIVDTSVYDEHSVEIFQEWESACYLLSERRMFITEDGYIGLIGEEVLPGDVVFCVAGCRYFTVLRPKDDHYLFVDSCFVIGLMDGEIKYLLKERRVKAEIIELR
ncbi:unnamed protein product [Fusarium venenatum]|uniref:Heterokaryon incompatibility domain-containing protein n=1 Tax=Fusarium venenatum TaxID=56646 RepID=A0A2L2TED8_9HYPO|nr:uncharacterized protein FVRRES_09419 [Fusarium venenatum]CEI69342.1 unnamed protein product [Fusarium venenatum]